jgi:nucleoside 2-deoxyribosyltransferase
MTGRRIVLLGEVVVDVTHQTPFTQTKLRMGGVLHGARALWAIGAEYEIAHYCPTYVEKAVQEHAKIHRALRATKVGDISGCPNVMLIDEPTEAGSQFYEHLLREEAIFVFDADKFRTLASEDDIDVLILSGNFALAPVLAVLAQTRARVHLDLGNGPTRIEDLAHLGRPFSTLFLSTSTSVFPSLARELPASVQALAGRVAEKVLLKENRGGARLFGSGSPVHVGSQRRDIVHSVGVGDAFDAVFVSLTQRFGDAAALSYASWIAAEYAATTFPDDFQRGADRTLKIAPEEIVELPSVSLPWESRPACQVYIAAPDFDYVKRRHIDALVECLRYHNFSPRLPVRENGQARDDTTAADKRKLYDADMALLKQCGLLIAVYLYDDPGTMIEIGLAHAIGIPIVVYDPCDNARNVMLTQAPELVTSSLDKVITAAFDIVARICTKS